MKSIDYDEMSAEKKITTIAGNALNTARTVLNNNAHSLQLKSLLVRQGLQTKIARHLIEHDEKHTADALSASRHHTTCEGGFFSYVHRIHF